MRTRAQAPEQAAADPSVRMTPERTRRIQLVLLAAAILYLELAIIRFTSAQVLYLGYFSNFVLISVFVGLGLGFLAARRPFDLRRIIPFVLLFLFALVLVSEFDVNVLRNRGGLHFFGNRSGDSGLPGVVLLPLLFVSTVALFAALAQQTARLFGSFTPLAAYTLDVVGSLTGVGLFSLQSYLWTPPQVWVLTGGALLALSYLLDARRSRAALEQAGAVAVAAAAVAVLLLSSHAKEPVLWSTYQKLELRRHAGKRMDLYANGVLHQIIQPAARAQAGFYRVPFEVQRRTGGKLGRVLIIGAGTGTDVALALRNGARAVDAVEIDEGIFELGRQHHPDRPYQDRRVSVHLEDGRQFLRHTPYSYDLILFALPDSLILLSSMSDLRLESYLFTVEAFREARARLAPGGTLVLYNQYRWDWLRSKIGGMLAEVFGRQPLAVQMGATTIFAAGERLPPMQRAAPGASPRPATDDWPFVYMLRPAVSWPYLAMIGMFLFSAILGVALLAPRDTLSRPEWSFFFMGTAFLLLETKSISHFSLLFGSTWLVNSLVFGGILLSVLIANLVAARWPIRQRNVLFAALLLALALAYLLPPASTLSIRTPALRYFLAVTLVFSPVFLANLIFSQEFRDAEESARAFGWNMLGAVLGGGLEYLALLIGHRNLLWIVAICYLITRALLPRRCLAAR